MTRVTEILSEIEKGDASAAEQLLPLIYDELRQLAAVRMASEQQGHTLQATALVHEAYIRLVKNDDQVTWDSRGHFFASAAEAMRRILIDRARQKQRPKHGGDRQRLDLEILCPATEDSPERLLSIHEALSSLENEHSEAARLVKLRYFAGVPLNEAAKMLGISLATAKRRWAFARAFLFGQLVD